MLAILVKVAWYPNINSACNGWTAKTKKKQRLAFPRSSELLFDSHDDRARRSRRKFKILMAKHLNMIIDNRQAWQTPVCYFPAIKVFFLGDKWRRSEIEITRGEKLASFFFGVQADMAIMRISRRSTERCRLLGDKKNIRPWVRSWEPTSCCGAKWALAWAQHAYFIQWIKGTIIYLILSRAYNVVDNNHGQNSCEGRTRFSENATRVRQVTYGLRSQLPADWSCKDRCMRL